MGNPSPPRMHEVTVSMSKAEGKTSKSIYFPAPRGFSFLPGQFINVYLPKGISAKAVCRSYTISSPPGEKRIRITVRAKGDFSRELFRKKKGSKIRILGPLGKFVFRREKFSGKKVVFIAGGIGIAGFSGALAEIERKGGPESSLLLYSERDSQDIPLEGEILALKRTRTVLTFTGSAPKGWTGMTGRIDGKALKGLVKKKDAKSAHFFICGSDGFVKDIRRALLRLGVSEGRLHSEGFG